MRCTKGEIVPVSREGASLHARPSDATSCERLRYFFALDIDTLEMVQ